MRKKKGGDGGANWMDTYGDMVTLLLCFFVLLYSMSTLDQQKWEALVRSFNPDAIPEITETMGNEGPIADPIPSKPLDPSQVEIEAIMQALYERLQSYVEEQGAENSISVTQGDGYVFISMDDAVFFAGDSYVLRQEGKQVLDDVGVILSRAESGIDEVRILGHTAQATANDPNNPTVDRFLASNRATVVLVYLQENTNLDPARLVSMGFGQWRPVASNAVPAERAKNRRVEMIVTGRDLTNELGDSITQYYTARGTAAPLPDEGVPPETIPVDPQGAAPEEVPENTPEIPPG